MLKRNLLIILAFASAITVAPLLAEEKSPAPGQNQIQQQSPVRGRDLMTPDELAQHREKMRSFKTEKERRAYREEHHKKMQERAKQKGLTLPDKPRQGYGGGQSGVAPNP